MGLRNTFDRRRAGWRMLLVCVLLPAAGTAYSEEAAQMLRIRRIFVEKLGGGETAGHMRNMLIAALQATGLFAITENEDRADAVLRGSGEDLIFTDVQQSSESIGARTSIGSGRSGASLSSRGVSASVTESEAARIAERKHEATLSVRLVSREGDVLWSTTQESFGGKFRGAAADAADKVARRLAEDLQRIRSGSAPASAATPPP